jgi:hypothetical protein
VQGFASTHTGGAPPTHVPAEQTSFVVQAFASLHGFVLLACVQPVAELHASLVQPFPSSQLSGWPPTHDPVEQISPVVQALPSLHGLLLFVNSQPIVGSQESSVQTLPSLQVGGGPPTQAPSAQVSLVVHALPSLHGLVLFTFRHPMGASQLSSVQTLPSPQLGGGPPTHTPPEQASPVVQAFPSLQSTLLSVNAQPVPGSHVSVVQRFPSLHTNGGPPTHAPATQVSFVVQVFPSVQEDELLKCSQPVAGLQESSVQMLPSLQSGGGPPTHSPSEQASFVVQAFPSLHWALLFVNKQPCAGSQLSSVQTLASLQTSGGPPRQDPPEHVSPVVHGFPSSHWLALLVCVQPVAGLHASVVQTLPSSQLTVVPPQTPPKHTSPVVHTFPSSHDAVLLAYTQIPPWHESVVHKLPSSHGHSSQPTIGIPPHVPPAQTSPLVHG